MHTPDHTLQTRFAQACGATAGALPSANGTTWLDMGTHRTWVLSGLGPPAEQSLHLPLGTLGTATAPHFRHEWPTPLELERAIDAVETALARLKARPGAVLVSTHPLLKSWFQAATGGGLVDRMRVEDTFQRLASAALGNPLGQKGLPTGREAAMALLMAREFMHHLDHSHLLCP